MHLLNTARVPLQTHYGGVCYRFEPGERKLITNHKVMDRRSGKTDEIHMAEDITTQVYGDLGALGLVMIDDEHPLSDEQYEAMGKEARVAFISGLIADFNALNSEIATGGGKKILAVPKHYRALQKERLQLMKELGTDQSDDDFLSEKELKEIQERSNIPRSEAVSSMLKAIQSGDQGAIAEAARAIADNDAASPAGDFVGDTPDGEFSEHSPAAATRLPRRGKRGG